MPSSGEKAISTSKRSWGHRLREQWHSPVYQLKIVLLLIIIMTTIGVSFYRFVLGWGFRDALLQIVLTISTLGGTARPDMHNPRAEWFEIFFVISILLVALWGVTLLIEAMARGEFVKYWGERRMERRIARMADHYIICGFGRMGQEIARQFEREGKPFVVVEHNPLQLPALEVSGFLYVQGDAREDDHLLRAGIERARGLVAVAATDEENVYITLSARVLNPKLYIVTRCSHAAGETKLLRAGANRVFSPYIIGGRRMAQAMMRPSVVELLDTIIHGEEMELVLEEVTVEADAPICGKAIGSAPDMEAIGVHLLGIATNGGRILMKDLHAYLTQPGDTLILLGDSEAMRTAIKQLTGKDFALFEAKAATFLTEG